MKTAQEMIAHGSDPSSEAEKTQDDEALEAASEEIDDDRHTIQPGDQVLLIVEDDPAFASLLLDQAHQQGFKGIVSTKGAPALELARQFQPTAITLDIRLPDTNGWIVLDRLKHSVETRHIPVHIISILGEAQRALKQGAIAWLKKPVTQEDLGSALATIKDFAERKVRHLLVVEDDEGERRRILDLIGNSDVQVQAATGGGEALAALKSGCFDCMVLDLSLPDISAFQLIRDIRKGGVELTRLPIILYTRKALTRKQEGELHRLAGSMIVEGVRSLEGLLYKTTILLHRAQANLPEAKQQALEQIRLSDPDLAGKKVLIVDDDARNVFALTSLLERHKMQVVYAESGQDGMEILKNRPDIDIALMDIMLPEMDGYETIRRLREDERFKSLPIIALTAKAMKGDRERCIEVGASDYIAKPIDNEELLSLLRVWSSGRLS
jgi:CheY-like chemotaxis protein